MRNEWCFIAVPGRHTWTLAAGRWLLDASRWMPTVLRRPSWDDRLALAWTP